jgi:hypothetical protein
VTGHERLGTRVDHRLPYHTHRLISHPTATNLLPTHHLHSALAVFPHYQSLFIKRTICDRLCAVVARASGIKFGFKKKKKKVPH